MPHFGFLRNNAEIVEIQEKGETTVVTIHAIGMTVSSAKRGAKREADSVIPVSQQEVIKVTEVGSVGPDNEYLINISE